jgi:hypothetical protein
MRPEFRKLVELGQLPADDGLEEDAAQLYVDGVDALRDVPTAEEVHALIRILPPDDSTAFGLAWSVLHAIEASPAWPIWSELDDRNWWVSHMRERCERGGLASPD